MATIGNFKKSGNEYTGSITTLTVQAKNVRIVPEETRSNDNAPPHRVFAGRVEIGATWDKRSNEGRDYLGPKLDNPNFTAPIYADLFDDEGAESFSLIWSRSMASLRQPLRKQLKPLEKAYFRGNISVPAARICDKPQVWAHSGLSRQQPFCAARPR